MKTMTGITLAVGLFLIGLAPTAAQADAVIFSNLGPGESYNGYTSYAFGTFDGGADYYVFGSAFTAGATMQLSTVEVAAVTLAGANQLTINLDADSAGSPGSTIESFTLNGAMPPFVEYTSGNLVVADSVLHPVLTAGTQYWVVLSVPNDGVTFAGWDYSSTNDTGPIAVYDNGSPVYIGPATPLGAMLITGVPEPSNIVMVGAGAVVILGCGLRRRRRAKSA